MMQPPMPSSASSPQAPSAEPELRVPDTMRLPIGGNRATCTVCGTVFAPQASEGKCPVCGEQVVRPSLAAGETPIISSAWRWLRHGGNWRVAAVAALVLYQIIVFIILLIHLSQAHAL